MCSPIDTNQQASFPLTVSDKMKQKYPDNLTQRAILRVGQSLIFITRQMLKACWGKP